MLTDMPIICFRSAALLVLLVPALALTSAIGGPAVIYLTALIALGTLVSNAFKQWEPFDFRI